MNRFAIAATLSLVSAAVLAAPLSFPVQAPPAATAQPPANADAGPSGDAVASTILAKYTGESRSAASVAKANALMLEVATAYRELPTLTDTLTLTIDALGNTDTVTFAVALGKGSDARLAMQGATMVSLDGQVTLVADEPADRALRVPLRGDLMTTLRETLGNFAPPVTILDLRAGRPLTSEALGLLALESPVVAGLREEGGKRWILVVGANGASEVSVDGATKLLGDAQALFAPPGAPEGFVMNVSIKHEAVVAAALSAPIVAHVGDRRIVTSIEDYLPTTKMIEVGQPAPTWTMRSLDGAEVKLADLKGSVVVLDFWASYCAPCKRAMPYLDEFARWAASSGKPIRVFAVNTLESGDAAARVAGATDWWRDQKFSLACLMDIDDRVADAMGIRVLPTTVVIGPDGVVRAIQQHLDSAQPGKLVDDLKAAVEKAQ